MQQQHHITELNGKETKQKLNPFCQSEPFLSVNDLIVERAFTEDGMKQNEMTMGRWRMPFVSEQPNR